MAARDGGCPMSLDPLTSRYLATVKICSFHADEVVTTAFCYCFIKVSIQLLQNIFKGLEEGSTSIPWPAVHHLVGGICYGGKVTDAQDMRALMALLIRNCSEESIDEGYGTVQVCESILLYCISWNYRVIMQKKAVRPGSSYDKLTMLIEELPDKDTPSALGLSPVLQSTLIKNESKSLISTLRQVDISSRSKG